jgi:hypothetical protein
MTALSLGSSAILLAAQESLTQRLAPPLADAAGDEHGASEKDQDRARVGESADHASAARSACNAANEKPEGASPVTASIQSSLKMA